VVVAAQGVEVLADGLVVGRPARVVRLRVVDVAPDRGDPAARERAGAVPRDDVVDERLGWAVPGLRPAPAASGRWPGRADLARPRVDRDGAPRGARGDVPGDVRGDRAVARELGGRVVGPGEGGRGDGDLQVRSPAVL